MPIFTAALDSINSVVALEHGQGIVYQVLGHQAMRDRIATTVINYHGYVIDPNAPESLQSLVEPLYRQRHIIPGIPDAITLPCVNPESAPRCYSFTYPPNSNNPCFIVDIKMDDSHRARIVPLSFFRPYLDNPGRAAFVHQDKVDPVPLWVVGSRGMGISVNERAVELQHGNKRIEKRDGRPRTTVNIVFEWPGYERYTSQIKMDSNKLSADDYTFRRLINQVNSRIRLFISKKAVPLSNVAPRWAVGGGEGQITADNLLLLAVVFVSEGTIVPIIKVRGHAGASNEAFTRLGVDRRGDTDLLVFNPQNDASTLTMSIDQGLALRGAAPTPFNTAIRPPDASPYHDIAHSAHPPMNTQLADVAHVDHNFARGTFNDFVWEPRLAHEYPSFPDSGGSSAEMSLEEAFRDWRRMEDSYQLRFAWPEA